MEDVELPFHTLESEKRQEEEGMIYQYFNNRAPALQRERVFLAMSLFLSLGGFQNPYNHNPGKKQL